MWNWIKTLDNIMRGAATDAPALADGKLRVPVFGLLVLIDLLGMLYGVCMGVFAFTPGGSGHHMQMLASTLKVPALFLLTLLVTFPSLYVFNALVGSRLNLPSVLRLLVAALALMLAVLSSIGPIVAFFSFTTSSYPFMILLNVIVYGIAGAIGLGFLLQTLHRLTLPVRAVFLEPTTTDSPMGLLDHDVAQPIARQVRAIFHIWVIVFGLVGCQMAWVLRPFIGHPGQPFTWFRAIHSNFFQAVADAVVKLVS